MDEGVIVENNKLIAEFMGYKYYKKVLLDWSDCGGIYEWTDVFSKIPILTNDYLEDEQRYFQNGFPGKDYAKIIYNPNYDGDWNQLMPVIEKILLIATELNDLEKFSIITDQVPYINEVYKAVVEFIKWYNGKIDNN